ncbi:FliI/YscN family ATPase [Legionella bononiensis]|uniref:protein-secreting ATPase n=1 Tax=Legionella bononiensis TaxID=2793102 RepID=A0ABS1WD44_9GAMM|nr:FliI/YscN family ATPase [Legionella bononiensis]MBL7479150.1 FliI/YscN family ATPase [Legionella bononiensis]MBL7527283.1 FliI/YscN family ATPase [Legionella bononiensis]MBL7562252.1 FliI/YscN family ATPase [Legionella bononiensis]
MHSWINRLQSVERLGEIEQSVGLKLVANGPPHAFIGEVCELLDQNHKIITKAEVVGFEEGKVYLMPYDTVPIRMGYRVRATGYPVTINASPSLLGHVVDAFAAPIDHPIPCTFTKNITTQNKKINPFIREPITERLNTGIHAIDSLLPMGKGQRIGVFSGSGVGKTTLLATIAQQSTSDINIIALIGERGREVNEFIHHHLNKDNLKKSILVVACSDEPALMRRQAAYTATTLAEYFCQQSKNVLLFMDSITRFAMAQREIGLSLGEPPTARGYTPSVFSLLPGLIERTGNFQNQGSISAIYTVLVEGDDFNEPLADHMRALLDGHIVLKRELAQRGHYPAISVLHSISRLANQLLSDEENKIVKQVISTLSIYQQNKDLIELGAYKPGNNKLLDHAVSRIDSINQILTQDEQHSLSFSALIQSFKEILQ